MMTRSVVGRWWAAALGVVAVAMPVAAQSPGDCFDTHLGDWSPVERFRVTLEAPPPDESGDSLEYSFPSRIRLTDRPSRNHRHVEVPTGALDSPHPLRLWSTEADTLLVHFTTGYGGVSAVVGRSPDGWEGRLGTGSDVAGLRAYERPIRLSRVDCDAPPLVTADEDRRIPRSVALTSGEGIALAGPLSSSLPREEQSSGSLRIPAPTSGLFRGADELFVRIDSVDAVKQITLLYAYDFSIDGLIRDVEEEFGAGSMHEATRSVSWRNRTTTMRVYRISNAPGQHRVIIRDPRFGR